MPTRPEDLPPGPYLSADARPVPANAPVVGGVTQTYGPANTWDYRAAIRGRGMPGQQIANDYGPGFGGNAAAGEGTSRVVATANNRGVFNAFSDQPSSPATFEGTGLAVGPGGYPINPPAVGTAARNLEASLANRNAVQQASAGGGYNTGYGGVSAPGSGYATFNGGAGVGGGGMGGGYATTAPRAGSNQDAYGIGADIAASRARLAGYRANANTSILDMIKAGPEARRLNALQNTGIQAGQLGVSQGQLDVARNQQGVNWGNLFVNQGNLGVNQKLAQIHAQQLELERQRVLNDPDRLQKSRAYWQIGQGPQGINAAQAGQAAYAGGSNITQIHGPMGTQAFRSDQFPEGGIYLGYPNTGPGAGTPMVTGAPVVQVPGVGGMPVPSPSDAPWRTKYDDEYYRQ